MIQLSGTYNKGHIFLDETIDVDKPVKVIVTFVDEEIEVKNNRLTLNDFSFFKSRQMLNDVKGSISDAIIDERRAGL